MKKIKAFVNMFYHGMFITYLLHLAHDMVSTAVLLS